MLQTQSPRSGPEQSQEEEPAMLLVLLGEGRWGFLFGKAP